LRSTARNTKSWICRLSRKRTSSFCGCAFTSTSDGIDVEIQHVRGLAAAVQHVAIAEAHRVHQQAISHRAAVDEPELHVARGNAPPRVRPIHPCRPHGARGMIERERTADELVADDAREPRGFIASRDARRVQQRARTRAQPERDVVADSASRSTSRTMWPCSVTSHAQDLRRAGRL
jgi:hypothetical protein